MYSYKNSHTFEPHYWFAIFVPPAFKR